MRACKRMPVNLLMGGSRYVIGYILGDGWIRRQGNSYAISIATTDAHMVSKLKYTINEILPVNQVYIYKRPSRKKIFKNREITSKEIWNVHVTSKLLYDLIYALKYEKCRFKTPTYLTIDGERGFLAGLFDAEGSVCVNKKSTTLTIASKHKENLIPSCEIFKKLGIKTSCVQYNSGLIYICGFMDLIKFKQLIPIKNERKINKLAQSLANRKRRVYRRYSQEIKQEVESLFKQKVPIYVIAKRLDINKHSVFKWIDDAFPDREKTKIVGIIRVECENCGKLFPRKNSSNKRMKHHFCNSKCSGMWHSDYSKPIENGGTKI